MKKMLGYFKDKTCIASNSLIFFKEYYFSFKHTHISQIEFQFISFSDRYKKKIRGKLNTMHVIP